MLKTVCKDERGITMDERVIRNIGSSDRIKIGDVAEALGVSKTTVSRAISGKGRVSKDTRAKVLAYIEKHGYHPSPIAKGLVQSKTYNIGWVMPGDSTITDLPFFQRCMMGVIEVAALENYDVLVLMVFDHDMSSLERAVMNQKVDGIVLGRTLIDDERVEFLKDSGIPYVVIGSSPNEDAIQIDNDHISACKELTSVLIMKGIKKLALIGGDSNHVVNQTRKKGFELGVEEQGLDLSQIKIYMDSDNETAVEHIVDELIQDGTECIVCMDDKICFQVLEKLRRDNILIPDQIKIASFYNSDILSSNQPAITSLQYDPKELGSVACRALFDFMEGKEVLRKKLLSYEVILKGSTK